MYHPQTLVSIWYEDKYGKKWEYITRWNRFKTEAIEILEKEFDNQRTIFYTINDNTYELDYYNSVL